MMGYVFMRFGADFKPENVDRLREKVGECLSLGGIAGSTAYVVKNVLDELVCNILEHSKAHWVELEMHPEAKQVTLVLRDDGTEFDPGDAIRGTEIEKVVESEMDRSLGLYMVGQMASSWNYKRSKNGINELNLVVDI